MKKNGLIVLILSLIISCTVNESFNEEEEFSDDVIILMHSGDRLGTQRVVFKEVEVTRVMEQISATEEIEVLSINAFSGTDTNQQLSFKVYPNEVGNNLLFNNFFAYRFHRGLTVVYTNPDGAINLNVSTNNESELTATFSGQLKHFEQTTGEFVILDLSSGTISIKY